MTAAVVAESLTALLGARVAVVGECVVWQAERGRRGEGVARIGARRHPAHKVLFELVHGRVRAGRVLRRLCSEPACVNPAHFEVAHRRDVVTMNDSAAARNKRKTRCSRGHRFTERNTYRGPGGFRRCRRCQAEQARERYWARKASG